MNQEKYSSFHLCIYYTGSLAQGFRPEQLHKLWGSLNSMCELVVGRIVEQPACRALAAGSQVGAQPLPCQDGALPSASWASCQVFEESSFPSPRSHPTGALLWRCESDADTSGGVRWRAAGAELSQVADCRIPCNPSSAGTAVRFWLHELLVK